MSEMGYLVAAYAAVWLGVLGYVAWLGSRVARLRRESTALREILDEARHNREPSLDD